MYLVIRIRGTTGVKQGIASTLEMLRLNRISHAVLVDENPSYKGMLQKAKDYITWGTDYSTFEELANALLNGELKAQDIDMKPVFRLHPPRKGYKGIRHSVNEGGSLGYRGEDINNLAKRMA